MKATMRTRAAHKEGCACQVCKNVRSTGDNVKQMKAFRLSPGLYKAAQERAAQQGKKITQVVEELLQGYVQGK